MADRKYTNLTSGNDNYTATYNLETVNGGAGDDILISNPTRNYDAHNWLVDIFISITDFLGMNFNPSGSSTINGFTYADNVTLSGGAGNDTLISYGSSDNLLGGAGNDFIIAGDGNDLVFESDAADGGDDFIHTGVGRHQVYAGTGNDTVHVTSLSAGDKFWGGAGTDTLVVSTQVTTLLDLSGNYVSGGAEIDGFEVMNYYGGAGNDFVVGGAGNDIIAGGGAFDSLNGGAGNDTLSGNDGDDNLFGGAGNDQLGGGAGIDRLDGGEGSDTFIFFNKSESAAFSGGSVFNPDLIVSFDDTPGGAQDVFDLSRIDANDLLAGNQAFTVNNGDPVFEVGELIVSSFFDPSQGGRAVMTVYADTNGDGVADFGLRFTGLIATLDAGDFIL